MNITVGGRLWQGLWWWRLRPWGRYAYPDGAAAVYDALCLGPVEVRRFRQRSSDFACPDSVDTGSKGGGDERV